MEYQNLLYAVEDSIALVTINRPEKYNALNRQTISELERCVESIEGDAAVRAAILTGAGEKAFVAGADINELASLEPVQALSAPAAPRATASARNSRLLQTETCFASIGTP